MLLLKVSPCNEFIKLQRLTTFCCPNMVEFCQVLALAIALVSGWDLCGNGMYQKRGKIRRRIFLKMRRVGHFISHLSNVTYFIKVQVVPKPLTCPRGKSLLVECHPLDDQIVRALLLPTLVYAQLRCTFCYKHAHISLIVECFTP